MTPVRMEGARCLSSRRSDLNEGPHVLRRTNYPIGYRAPERRAAMISVPTCASIRLAVCEVYGVLDAALTEKLRTKTIAEARHVAVWFMRMFLKMSYPELGREIRRDHTSVISAIHRIDRELQKRPLLCARMASVADKLCMRFEFESVAGGQ